MIMYTCTCRCFVIGHENSLDLRHRDYYNIISLVIIAWMIVTL